MSEPVDNDAVYLIAGSRAYTTETAGCLALVTTLATCNPILARSMGVSTLRSGRGAQWRCLGKPSDSVASFQRQLRQMRDGGNIVQAAGRRQQVAESPTFRQIQIAISLPIGLLRYFWPVNVAPDCQVGVLCRS